MIIHLHFEFKQTCSFCETKLVMHFYQRFPSLNFDLHQKTPIQIKIMHCTVTSIYYMYMSFSYKGTNAPNIIATSNFDLHKSQTLLNTIQGTLLLRSLELNCFGKEYINNYIPRDGGHLRFQIHI